MARKKGKGAKRTKGKGAAKVSTQVPRPRAAGQGELAQPPQETQLYLFDLTIRKEGNSKEALLDFFKAHCKKFAFQLEKGEQTGYEHFQCKISLKVKLRKTEMINKLTEAKITGARVSISFSTKFTYVTKAATRIEGPWTDADAEPLYVPRAMRDVKLLPWQEQVLSWPPEDRHIYYIVDTTGNQGKSWICRHITLSNQGYAVPALSNFKDLMQFVCSLLKSRRDVEPKRLVFDVPRSLKKLHEFFSCIEQCKNGVLYDIRYGANVWTFEPPTVICFSNQEPQESLVSQDRWKIFYLDENELLTRSQWLSKYSANLEADI